MGPLQWMGAVRIRVQTADKNISHLKIDMTAVHQLTSSEVKSCVFIKNKQIHDLKVLNLRVFCP